MTTTDKLTPDALEDLIESETYTRPANGTLTICVLHLPGGVNVTGESNVIDPAYFDAVIGKANARNDAVSKLWSLEGYHRKRCAVELDNAAVAEAAGLAAVARGAYAACAPGYDALDVAGQDAIDFAAQAALAMEPDDDTPGVVDDLFSGNPTLAARFCVVARAIAGL